MTTVLYVAPWLLWGAAFFALEAYGFRRGHDRWPTLSQLWKRWEDAGQGQGWKQAGVSAWSWPRWFTAIGLPVGAALLELHWVLEVF
jgi:hypothetical protein